LKIRRATQNDLETVRELWEALYEECPEPEHERKDWEEVADDVRPAIEAHVTLLAEQDGEAVGFLLGRPKSERIGYVSDLYVLPEHRTRGIARELLTEAVAALGREVVTLDVDITNAAARSFYRRLGFHEQSLRLAIEAERLA
jgi:ribosomal protein S18 acetylase RimI-like enzyme